MCRFLHDAHSNLWSPCKTHLPFLEGDTAKTDNENLADAAGNQTVKSVPHCGGSCFPVLPRRHVQGPFKQRAEKFYILIPYRPRGLLNAQITAGQQLTALLNPDLLQVFQRCHLRLLTEFPADILLAVMVFQAKLLQYGLFPVIFIQIPDRFQHCRAPRLSLPVILFAVTDDFPYGQNQNLGQPAPEYLCVSHFFLLVFLLNSQDQ